MLKTYNGNIFFLKKNQIFVFGSNTQGRHGKGSALFALKNFGAIYGQAFGRQGRSYAIVTKDLTKKVHPSVSIEYITNQIKTFYDYAIENSELEFLVAYKGYGENLNSYTPKEMSNMFSYYNIPKNVVFEESFAKLIEYER